VITEDPGFATQIAHSRHALCVFFNYTTHIRSLAVTQITSGREARTFLERQRQKLGTDPYKEEKVLTK